METFLEIFILIIFFSTFSYLFYLTLKKLKIEIDEKLFYALTPWVLAAAFIRVFEDANIYPKSFFTQTPGILISLFILVIPFIILSKNLEKKIPFWKSFAFFGLFIALLHAIFFKINNWLGGLITISIFLPIFIFLLIIKKKLGVPSFLAIAGQMLDASATFVSIQFFNYYEKHLLPNFLIEILGPWIMFPLKFIIVLIAISLINNYLKDNKDLRNFMLLFVYVMGIAPGLRDLLRLIMNV